MEKLIHLRNIDSGLEQKLLKVGIDTPQMLREKGSRHVFVKLKSIDSCACYLMLLNLEGAIQGVDADNLSREIKEELKVFMEIFNR